MASLIHKEYFPMITLHTRVLNGLPIRAEADTKTDRGGDLEIDGIQLFWVRKTKNPFKPFTRATVIESKMSHNDWEMLEDELMDVALGRWIG